MKNLLRVLIAICMFGVVTQSDVSASGVSSIKNQTITKTQQIDSSASQERKLISIALKGFHKKYGIKKIRSVHDKLSDARILLAPKELRKYLVMIKEVIADEYKIDPIPTAAEIRATNTVPKASKIILKNNTSTEMETINSSPPKQKETPTQPEDQSNIQVIDLDLDIDTALDSGLVGLVQGSEYDIQNGTINIEILQNTWLTRVNQTRKERGRSSIKLSQPLHVTATERSETMKRKGVADHRRFSNSSYYNYGQLVDWFENRGISFLNVQRATFTENIGYGRFTCNQGDCTQAAINTMRTVFDYFISEEGTTSDAHRRTIIHPKFKIMGLGIAIDESKKRLYITQHYGTQIE